MRLTKEQAIIVSAYTGFLICNFSDLQEAIEKKLGRPVWSHGMANKELLEEIKQAFQSDFISLAPEKEPK